MHINTFSDVEFLLIIGLTALAVWYVTRAWTLRRLGNEEPLSQHAPASLLEPIQAENAKLHALIERQEDRIRSLEAIATDPAARTAREIEALRNA